MNRTYVVTGSVSGIGRALVDRLERRGAHVVGVDREVGDVTGDLATVDGRSAILEEVLTLTRGSIDAVVCVAGSAAPVPDTLGVNFFGVVALLEGLRPALARAEQPRAAVVASAGAINPEDPELLALLLAGDEAGARARAERLGRETTASGGSQLYTTSKLAIASWVRSTAPTAEWAGAGIALNAIAPGIIDTPMSAPALSTQAGLEAITGSMPAPFNGPAAPPSAPAALLDWLTSEENQFLTAQVLFIDGGAEAIRRPERRV